MAILQEILEGVGIYWQDENDKLNSNFVAVNAELEQATLDVASVVSDVAAIQSQIADIGASSISCRNETGAVIPANTVCALGEDTGNGPLLTLNDADVESLVGSTPVVTLESIANNASGTCQNVAGVVTGFTGLVAGDIYHVSQTPGEISNAVLTEGFLRIIGQALTATTLYWADSGVWIGVAQPDSTAPAVPTGLTLTSTGETTMTVDWTDNTEEDVNQYIVDVTQGGTGITGSPFTVDHPTNTLSLTGLTSNTEYCATIQAVDNSSNASTASSQVCETTAAGVDNENPTVPTNLSEVSVTGSTINISWTASTDNVGVSHYLVRVDGGTAINVGDVTSYQITGLTSETQYSITVEAVDTSSNASGETTALLSTTSAQSAEAISFTTSEDMISVYMEFTSGTAQINLDGGGTVDITSGVQLDHSLGSTGARSHTITMTNPDSLSFFGHAHNGTNLPNYMDNITGLSNFVNLDFVYFYRSTGTNPLTAIDLSGCVNLWEVHLAHTDLTTEQVDQIFIDLDRDVVDTVSGKHLYIPAVRSSVSDAARTSLPTKGWTVSEQ